MPDNLTPGPLMPDLLAKAIALHRQGLLSEAEPLYRRALAAKPSEFDALHMLGVIALQQGRNAEALDLIRRALAVRPNSVWARSNLGLVLRALKRPGEAVASFERALALDPGDIDVLNNLSGTLFDLERYADALAASERALAIKSDCAEAFNNRGNALQEIGRLAQALASYDAALAIRPDFAEAWHNRGGALQALNRHREAVASYERALVLSPDYADAQWNESLARLCLGDFATGFAKYEWRWRTSDADPARQALPQPLWLGEEALHGKTILLHAEQGVGDCLQFVRYVPMVAGRGATVVLAVHRELKSLLAGFADAVFAEGELLPPCDLRCPLASLPHAFRTTLATIPADVPYLRPDDARAARWKSSLAASRGLRVGLAWAGNPAHKNDARRSIPFARLAPLLGIPDVQHVSLQTKLRDADREALQSAPPVINFATELVDFAETAALLANLDLIITVDTALAHLAGAMGKPTWILLPFSPDWRWLLDREDSPWYPTARLFRQPRIDDWESVIARVAAELRRFPLKRVI
jgi:tetratricopeptide (TPR) repeat protein